MSELQEYRLDEIAEVIDCEHKTAPRVEQSAFYSVRTPDILNGRIDYANCYRVDEPTYELWTRRGKPEAGDIILAREAPVGEVGLIQPGYNVCLGQRTVLIKVNREVVDSSYLTFHLCAPPIKTELKEQSGGSVVSHLNMKDIRAFRLSLPDLTEQRAIASVLSSLDAKIDLLHRQNKTLEAMAETLFRQWFVKEAEEGWEEKPLGSFGRIVCGKTPSKKVAEYHNGSIPFIRIPDMHGQVYLMRATDSITEKGKASQLNKTLPVGAVCVSCIATVGLVSITTRECQTNQQINSIIPGKEHYRYYLYLLMLSIYEELHAMASGGTATLNLNTSSFTKMLVPSPPDEVLRAFHGVVAPLFDKMLNNCEQLTTLTKLRDTLLPKLMSGEVRVEETSVNHSGTT